MRHTAPTPVHPYARPGGHTRARPTHRRPAQGVPSRGYVFADEPLVSINRSYLGYSNFVDPGPGLPAHADPPGRNSATTRALTPAGPVYLRSPSYYYVPARPRMRWFGWRRGYGYGY